MNKEIGVGRAHSKIILIGEHAVVYGYPAIALPLHHIEVICQIIPADSPWVLFEDDTLSMAVLRLLSTSGLKRPGFAAGFSPWYRKTGDGIVCGGEYRSHSCSF